MCANITVSGIVFVASGMYNEFDNPVYFAKFIFEILPYGKYIFIFFITVFAISNPKNRFRHLSQCLQTFQSPLYLKDVYF